MGLSEQEAIWRCNKCGACTAVCPLYQQLAEEGMAARGKIALVEGLSEGAIRPSRRLQARLEDCLLCAACAQNCPSLVPTTKLFLEARAHLARALGQPAWLRLFLLGLSNPGLLGLGMRGMRWLQLAGLTAWHATAGLPNLPAHPAFPPRGKWSTSPGANPGSGAGAVAYFAGCFMNWVYADVARATQFVLTKNGCRVEAPPVHCCGMPHRSYGGVEASRRLARRNIDALRRYDAVITDCATCGAALKEYGEWLAGDPEYAEEARSVSRRVFDICEFLVEHGFLPPKTAVNLRVTYHEPCHLGRTQGVKQQPRKVLCAVPGVELVEMTNADACCGGAGLFSLTHPDLAEGIGAEKAASIRATAARAVASGCPSCMRQLRSYLGGNVAVCHPVELLALGYGSTQAERTEQAEQAG